MMFVDRFCTFANQDLSLLLKMDDFNNAYSTLVPQACDPQLLQVSQVRQAIYL